MADNPSRKPLKVNVVSPAETSSSQGERANGTSSRRDQLDSRFAYPQHLGQRWGQDKSCERKNSLSEAEILIWLKSLAMVAIPTIDTLGETLTTPRDV